MGQTLSESDAFAIGLSFGTLLRRAGKQNIIIGRDGRLTSPALQQKLVEALRLTGCHVFDIGIGPTPMTYFSNIHTNADAAIMVTGSHNEASYNGFKFVFSGKPFYGHSITQLGAQSANADWDISPNLGDYTPLNTAPDYVARLASDIDMPRPLRIAWDAGNGAAGEVLKSLIPHIPGEHFVLYADIDGNFPNHHPDPTVDKNLADLIAHMRQNNCDIGIAFDGDGDRIGAVDEQGNIIRCDMLLLLYAAQLLQKTPGATIIGDIKCSDVLFNEIKRLGGTPIMWKTGHSLIKAKMAETNAPLAGELSGHIFMAEGYYGYDDALYCAVRLLNILSQSHTPLSAHFAHIPARHSTPEIRIDVNESQKQTLMEKLTQTLPSLFEGEDITLTTLDGIRIDTPKGWLLIRASNTQNALVTRLEADTPDTLQSLKQRLQSALEQCDLALPSF